MASGGAEGESCDLETGSDNAVDMSENMSNMNAPVYGETVSRQQYEGLAGQVASYQLILERFDKEMKEERERAKAEREDLLSEIEELKREKEMGPFTVVKNNNKRVRSPVQQAAMPGLSTQNRFEPISSKRLKGQQNVTVDDYDTDEDEEIIEATRAREAANGEGPSQTVTRNVPKKAAITTTTTTAQPAAAVTKKHSPDFIVRNLPAPAFERAMREKNVKVMVKPLPKGEQKMICEFENRGTVLEWLKENNVRGTTSTCRHERIGCALVKGISADYTEEEVKTELEQGINFQLKSVKRFKEPSEGERPFNWWVVTTENMDQIEEVKKQKWFYGCFQLRWEKYVATRAPRCFNCQQYRHLAKNCFRATRCANCKTEHETKRCLKKKPTNNMQPAELRTYYCVPCGTRGHFAGWARCPTFLRETESFRQKMQKQQDRNDDYTERKKQPQRRPNPEDFVVNEKRGGRKGPAPAPTTGRPVWIQQGEEQYNNQEQVSYDDVGDSWGDMDDEVRRLFGMDPMELMKKIRNFKGQTRNLNDSQKARAYLNFYSSLCPN